MPFDVVEAQGLVKLYGATRALSGVNARFEAGQVTSVEGHNGSGKSTLLGLLSLMARPTRGRLRFGELDPRKAAGRLRAHIGVLAHAAMVYPELSGLENLRLVGRLYGVAAVEARIAELRQRFELGAFAERPTRTYSRGQLQRISLARAIFHQPRLLLLDEPSTGLDVASTQRLQEAIRKERERGAIVVLVTHDRALAETTADAHLRLERGRVVEGAAPTPPRSAVAGSSENTQRS